MIEKIMRLLGIGTLYFAASLFFASLLLAGYFWYAWGLNKERLLKAVAVAQGFDIYGTEEKIRDEFLQRANDIRYQTVLDERVKRHLNEDLSDSAVNEALAQIQSESQQINSNKAEIEALRNQLQKQIADFEEESKNAGITELTTIYESIEAELAKKYVLDMIEKGEYVKVIYVFRKMDLKKRAKIINEFQDDDELSKLAGVLRRIGNGEPEAELVEALRQEMEQIQKKSNPITQ